MHALFSLLKRDPSFGLTAGFQLALLVVGALGPRAHAKTSFFWSFILIALLAMGAWWIAIARARSLQGLPVSAIQSAAQGYVKLAGLGAPLLGQVLPVMNGRSVVWYRIETYERRYAGGGKVRWVYTGSEEILAPFMLQDSSGHCLVSNERAEVLADCVEEEIEGDTCWRTQCIYADQAIYVLGSFRSKQPLFAQAEKKQRLQTLLANWKKSHQKLLTDFDRNQDGEIDLQEWEQVQQATASDVERQESRLAGLGPQHRIGRDPKSTRLFLISDCLPRKLAMRYRWWGAFHGAVFLLALAGLAYLGRH
jgi:hypothetical protein